MSVVDSKFLQLEKDIMEKIISEDFVLVNILKKQYQSAIVKEREFTGVGLYTCFEITDKELRISKPETRNLGTFIVKVNGILVDVILWVENGFIDCLELVTFGVDRFPEKIETYEFV